VTDFVITLYRHHSDLRVCNLRTQLERIIAKAGLKPRPRLFQNLRSMRETELAEQWPEHVVCAWIGNSKAVAREHHLQVTDEHFEQTTRTLDDTGGAAQNAAQQTHAEPRMPSLSIPQPAKFDVQRSYATTCEYLMGRVGFEPT
jgi:hypothetical protein